MATASINFQYQAPITCGLCEKFEDVTFFCFGCKGNLCSRCSKSHTLVPMFRNHKVVDIMEGLKFHSEEVACFTHPLHVCSMYCNDCDRPICCKCISSGNHSGHNISEIEVALQKVEREINEYHEALETIYLPQCEGIVAKIEQDKEECQNVAMSLRLDINDKRSDMIIEIHNICDGLINRVDDEEKCNILDMDNTIQNLQDTIDEIKTLKTESKEAVTKINFEKIKFNQEKPNLSHLDTFKAPEVRHSTFLPGTINPNQIAKQIGKLFVHRDLEKLSGINVPQGITSVDAVGPHHVLISGYYDLKELNLVSIDGVNTKCLKTDFEITDKTITASGDIILTDYKDECIRIMAQTGQITKTVNTHPNKPSGICLGGNDQEIIVCVNTPRVSRWKWFSFFQRRPSTEHVMFDCKLVVYNTEGKQMRTIIYTDRPVTSDKQYLTQRVTKNNRGDYCVAHQGHNKVYVVDDICALRYTYDGSDANGKTLDFVPWDICSDSYNHLIISDFYNHKIHMVDGEGNFLKFILIEQDGITFPTGLCVGKDGTLWVGQRYGGLCIVKYLK